MPTPDTGNGATIAFGTQGGSYNVVDMTGHEEEVASLDDTHLGTTGFMTSIPDDLDSPGEFEISVHFDSSDGLPNTKVVETITITYALKSGETTAGNIAGTGYITKRKFPDIKNGEIMVAKLTIKWDGKTGPALTQAA